MSQVNKCYICKKRNEVKPTYKLCSECYKKVTPEVQKLIVDNTLSGQVQGYIAPSQAFNKAIQQAIGDVQQALYGSRQPDKAVRDANNTPIELEDKVQFELSDTLFQGWIKNLYWEQQEITVRYYHNNLPKSIRLPSRDAKIIQKAVKR